MKSATPSPPGRPALFSEPGHDHRHCTQAILERAERLCARRNLKFTPIRRAVLEALARTHQPIGAYEVMQILEDGTGKRPAPITVYRALDFLVEHRLAHRIESRNAFVACLHDHAGKDMVMFFICGRCGAVGEAVSPGVGEALSEAATEAGFGIAGQVIELAGTCRHCREPAESPVPD